MNSGEGKLFLRPAAVDDQEIVFRWRNDPFILAHGSSSRAVSRAEHQAWFEETIHGLNRRMFIVVLAARPIGQVRFDRESRDECVISAYLLSEFIGRGLGGEAIRMGCAFIFGMWNVKRVIACVRKDNPRARRAFLRVGFNETENSLCPDEHSCLVLLRSDD